MKRLSRSDSWTAISLVSRSDLTVTLNLTLTQTLTLTQSYPDTLIIPD